MLKIGSKVSKCFVASKTYPDKTLLLYSEFPSHLCRSRLSKEWTLKAYCGVWFLRRVSMDAHHIGDRKDSEYEPEPQHHFSGFRRDLVGLMYIVSSKGWEAYYLCTLALNVCEAKRFDNIRNAYGGLCPTFNVARRKRSISVIGDLWKSTL